MRLLPEYIVAKGFVFQGMCLGWARWQWLNFDEDILGHVQHWHQVHPQECDSVVLASSLTSRRLKCLAKYHRLIEAPPSSRERFPLVASELNWMVGFLVLKGMEVSMNIEESRYAD
jgi:hypothetical protein